MDNFMKPIIETYYSQLQTSFENEILKGVRSVGVQVDKERLLQALKDAKEFWHEGYKDGYRAAVWEQPRWISVEERLPEDGVRVLTVCDDGLVRLGISKGGFPSVINRQHKFSNVTIG